MQAEGGQGAGEPAGGIAQFVYERGRRLRFTIRAESVQRSGLKMSSKLLSISDVVKGKAEKPQ